MQFNSGMVGNDRDQASGTDRQQYQMVAIDGAY